MLRSSRGPNHKEASRTQRRKKTVKAHILFTGSTPLSTTAHHTNVSIKSATQAVGRPTTKKNFKANTPLINLEDLRLATLPTPYPIILAEQLQEEDEKQMEDSRSPLRSYSIRSFAFDLPAMSRMHIPTSNNIDAVNDQLAAAGVSPVHFIKHPYESIPNFSKLSKAEKMMLQAGYIALIPGASQYTYLPMAMRVMEKLTALINEEMVQFGSQKVELPSVVEKKLLDDFQIYRRRMMQQNELLKTPKQKKLSETAEENLKSKQSNKNGEIHDKNDHDDDKNSDDDDDDDNCEELSSSIFDHSLSPYYRFYNLQDDELIVSPPLLDYYTALAKHRVKLSSQLPMALYQFSKKFRDINDDNAYLNGSTNIDETNEKIAQMRHLKIKSILNEDDEQDVEENDAKKGIQHHDFPEHHKNFTNDLSHNSDTLMNGLITSTEYHTLNAVTFHSDGDDAHLMYKATLDLFNRIFRKLNIRGVQVEADGSTIGAELSHEYHIVLGPTSGSKDKKRHIQQPPVTHALVQCGLCGYTANTEHAQFSISESFDHSQYNHRMKTGKLSRAMRNDPRSFGIFESSGGDPNFDREIRSKVTALIKQMMPTLARRDVPMVANVVKLHYAPGQDGFYDDISTPEMGEGQKQFINHSLIMIRADREFNNRAIARHFGCAHVEVLSASESALMLLKFQKFKQRQYQDQVLNAKNGGNVDAKLLDPSYNIFGDMHTRTLPMSTRDLERMYRDMNDVTKLEKEQRRLRRVAARRDVNAGLVIVCDNTLVAQGIDLDDEDMMDKKFLNEQNSDRSFGLKLNDSSSQTKSLVDRVGGYKTAKEFEAAQHVPPEYAKQFDTIFKAIKEGILEVDKKTGDLIINDAPEEFFEQFNEFQRINEGEDVDSAKSRILNKLKHDAEHIIDIEGENVTDESLIQKRKEVEEILNDEISENSDELVASEDDIDIFQLEADGKSVREIFESAIEQGEKDRRKKYWEQNRETEEIMMFEDKDGNIVDADGQVLPHITADTRSERDMRRAYGKKGYDQLDESSPNDDIGGILDEKLTSTVNPAQGDFVAPQPGDKCVQQACHSQGMLEGLRSIEVGKIFYLSDSLTRNTDAVVMSNKPNKQGQITNQMTPIHMTSYKIGVSRLMNGIIEAGSSDKFGLAWPEVLAPYQIAMICDPGVEINFKQYRTKLIDQRGLPYHKDLDIHQAYLNQAQMAAEEHLRDLQRQKKRLIEIAKTPGISPKLDHERNKIIQQAQDVIDDDNDDDDGEYNIYSQDRTKLKFGFWNWGLADNNTHTLNIASTLARSIPTLEDEIVYDDRHNLPIYQRLQDSFQLGIPWVIIVDEMMQEKGLVKVVNRMKQQMEFLSVDQVVHFFGGQRPLHQRPEYHKNDFERGMKYRVENAILSHFGKKAIHEGEADFFRLDNKQAESFDYNTHVDIHEQYDPDQDEAESPKFDQDRQLIQQNQDSMDAQNEYMDALRAKEQAMEGRVIPTENLTQDEDIMNPTKTTEGSSLLEETMKDSITAIKAGKTGSDVTSTNVAPSAKEGKAIDQWYHIIKSLRRRLPPPTATELDRMFRAGILFKDTNGEVQVNQHRAKEHAHVVYGVDPYVVDQWERGNILSLDSTGKGVSQVIDKYEYLKQQQMFAAQRIDKQLESGYFDITLNPSTIKQKEELKAEQMLHKNQSMSKFSLNTTSIPNQEMNNNQAYEQWKATKEQHMMEMYEREQKQKAMEAQERDSKIVSSLFGKIQLEDPREQYNRFSDARRADLNDTGVKFRSLRDGHAIIKKPGNHSEAIPFDVRYDMFDNTPVTALNNPHAKQHLQQEQQQHTIGSFESSSRYKKKSISQAFSSAPVLNPREDVDSFFSQKQ